MEIKKISVSWKPNIINTHNLNDDYYEFKFENINFRNKQDMLFYMAHNQFNASDYDIKDNYPPPFISQDNR